MKTSRFQITPRDREQREEVMSQLKNFGDVYFIDEIAGGVIRVWAAEDHSSDLKRMFDSAQVATFMNGEENVTPPEVQILNVSRQSQMAVLGAIYARYDNVSFVGVKPAREIITLQGSNLELSMLRGDFPHYVVEVV